MFFVNGIKLWIRLSTIFIQKKVVPNYKFMESKKPWYLSSSGAEKLSSTIKGFFGLGIVSALVIGLKLFGVDLDVDSINELVNSFGGLLVAVGGLGSAAYAFYGLVRRVWNKVLKLGKYSE